MGQLHSILGEEQVSFTLFSGKNRSADIRIFLNNLVSAQDSEQRFLESRASSLVSIPNTLTLLQLIIQKCIILTIPRK